MKPHFCITLTSHRYSCQEFYELSLEQFGAMRELLIKAHSNHLSRQQLIQTKAILVPAIDSARPFDNTCVIDYFQWRDVDFSVFNGLTLLQALFVIRMGESMSELRRKMKSGAIRVGKVSDMTPIKECAQIKEDYLLEGGELIRIGKRCLSIHET